MPHVTDDPAARTFDALADDARKLTLLTGSADQLDSVVWGATGSGKTSSFVRSIVFDSFQEAKTRMELDFTWAESEEDDLRRFEVATDELNLRQRKWIAKGLREWEPVDFDESMAIVSDPGDLEARSPSYLHEFAHYAFNAMELGDHLAARHRAEKDLPTRNSRVRPHDLPEWLRQWLPAAIRALVSGLGKKPAADIVAPKLGPQTLWGSVATHVNDLGRLIDRLADTIFPNAPTPSRLNWSFKTIPGGSRIRIT